jgi:hypothetical protein
LAGIIGEAGLPLSMMRSTGFAGAIHGLRPVDHVIDKGIPLATLAALR